MDLSLVIPARDEEESIAELGDWIGRVMDANGFSYEAIFIDDGSHDATWEEIEKLSKRNPACKGLRFNRNYGKSAALHAGFQLTQGQVVVTLDADLQDSPDEFPELYAMIKKEGYHLVSGWKKKRNDPITKRWPSRFFNRVTRLISGIKLHDFNCGLKAYHHKVVKHITVYGEMHRYIPVLAKWAGYTRIGEKVVVHHERKYGYTKFGLERFVRGFLDLLTVHFVGRFAQRPMHFFGFWGLLSFFSGLVLTGILLWNKVSATWLSGTRAEREIIEQPIFFIALVAILLGAQLFLTGFLAELFARQQSSKKRYIIAEQTGALENI